MQKKIQIWGMGNALLGDDAAGSIISVELGGVDCGTTPENYIPKLRKAPPDVLIIIDAADMGLEPGSVRVLDFDDIGGVIATSHGIPLSVLLEPFRESTKIFFIGIQPERLTPGAPLSPPVRAAADFIIQTLTQ